MKYTPQSAHGTLGAIDYINKFTTAKVKIISEIHFDKLKTQML